MSGARSALLAAALVTVCGLSQGADQRANTAPARTGQPSADTVSWAALTPAQNAALAPLRSDWNSLDASHQQKWLQMAQNMATMPELERRRIQQRMAQWSQLSPEKRGLARQRFLEARQLPSPQRQARWLEYQALSAEQKGRLAAQARTANPPEAASPAAGNDRDSGAIQGLYNSADNRKSSEPLPAGRPKVTSAPVLQARPGATTRALTTPSAPPVHHLPGMPKIVATDGFVDPATLLPKRGPQGAAVRSALTGDKASDKRSDKP